MKAWDLATVTAGAWKGYVLLEDGRLFHLGLARARPPSLINGCAAHRARGTSRTVAALRRRLQTAGVEPVEIAL